MKAEDYAKATPLIKELEEIRGQIRAVQQATTLKFDAGGSTIGINIPVFGDEGLSRVRKAIIETLEEKKKKIEDELAAL